VGSRIAIRVRNGAKAANCAPLPPYSQHRFGNLFVFVQQRVLAAVPSNNGQRIVHDTLDIRRHVRFTAGKQVDWQRPVPHGAVRRAVDGLILSGEERFHLVVGRVNHAGATRFVRALAA
jgi:hypothetical protein